MPKFIPNKALIETISGAIGDLVFYRNAEGNLIVQKKGERATPPSEKQVAQKELLKLASAYGNRVKLDPVLSAEYRPFCRGRMRPYHAAVRDFMVPPKIAAINLESIAGQPGELIRILASDDTRVMSVEVIIRHAIGGAILEQGWAGLSVIADQWLYSKTTAIPSGTPILIEATAIDRPGNRTAARGQFTVS